VLVVDDAADSCEMLAKYLELQGHAVRTAHDGMEALVAVAEFHPEIIFLDLCMPRMSGFEVCARLRENPAMKDVAIFALSGLPNTARTPDSTAAWFDGHLLKPIESELLEALISTVTRRR
jgi:CheY-like chemotaxis protein